MLSTICLPAFCIENQLDEQKKQLLQGPANPKHSQEQSNKKITSNSRYLKYIQLNPLSAWCRVLQYASGHY